MNDKRIMRILKDVKSLANTYRRLTGKPLGVTGEIAEYEASRILGIELMPARNAGYDALDRNSGRTRRLQIKARCLLPNCKPGQRLGKLDLGKRWDAALMVILDESMDAIEIHEATRRAVCKALTKPGSKARNERGSLPVSTFKRIGKLRWRRKEIRFRAAQ
jgi:hypothetical protein